jgi:DNA-directed RNA polymerase II subunit RPB1
VSDDNWMIETDGVGLSQIFPVEMVDFAKTISNDVIEIKDTLGIEAAR